MPNYEPDVITNELSLLRNIFKTHLFSLFAGHHLQIAEKCQQEHFQSPCAVSGIQNNFNPTRNSESAKVSMHQIPSMEEKSATSSAKPVSLLYSIY